METSSYWDPTDPLPSSLWRPSSFSLSNLILGCSNANPAPNIAKQPKRGEAARHNPSHQPRSEVLSPFSLHVNPTQWPRSQCPKYCQCMDLRHYSFWLHCKDNKVVFHLIWKMSFLGNNWIIAACRMHGYSNRIPSPCPSITSYNALS